MKYKTEAERKAAMKAYQAAYRKAKKDGTWKPKSEIGKGRVIDLGSSPSLNPHPSSLSSSSSPIPHTSSLPWEEIVMPYLGSRLGDGTTKRGKGRKLTAEEKRAAKSEWQRRYRELKRLAYHLRASEPGGPATGCAGKPKRGRKKYKTEEEAKEAVRAYHRAYGKKYRALKKSGKWVPKATKRRDEGCGMRDERGACAAKKPGRRPVYATEAERRAAKNEYNRKYHLLRKTGLWVRKNRIFSERVAKGAGLLTEKERLAGAMPTPAKRLFGSEAEWREAITVKRGRKPKKRESREERRKRILEKYGFDIKTPVKKLTPEEQEARKRWLRDEDAAYRQQHHARITVYNRDYRRRKRAEALAVAQQSWTAEEWEKWRQRQAAKERGEPTHFVKEVVKFLAETSKLKEEAVMAHLLEHGGVDFLTAGAEAIGKDRAKRPAMVKAAARAVAFYVDPDNAVMFPERA